MAALPLLLGAGGDGDQRGVAYTLSPAIVEGKLQALDVAVRFAASPSGKTGFGWEEGWDGQETFHLYARDLTVSGASSVRHDADGHWRIEAPAATPLIVRYRIVSGPDTGTDLDKYDRTAPFIRPRWFSALGFALFGRPDDSLERPATFDWTGAPPGYPFVSDVGHLSTPARQGVRPGTVGDIVASTVVGGPDVTVIDDRRRSGLEVGIIPGSVVSATRFGALVERVTAAERRFWNVDGPLPYAITATPVPNVPGHRYVSGGNFSDGFGIWTGDTTRLSDLAILVAHEYFHNWQSQALGHGFSEDGEEQREAWFGEGFTDYFAWSLALRSGAISPEQFRDQWNDVLTAYWSSPLRNARGDDAARDFFKNHDAERLPYQRGALLAARWNARLRDEKKGDLRAILLAQLKAAKHSGETPVALFQRIAAEQGLSVTDDIRRYNRDGETLRLAPDTFAPCARVVTERRRRFDAGFDWAATDGNAKVAGNVETDSNAYRAGLRNGMRVVERTTNPLGDPTIPYTFRVQEGDRTRTIEFLPATRARMTVQKLELRMPVSAACANSLSGIRSL